jgi:hypothetical protein
VAQPELPPVPLERWLSAKTLAAKFARNEESAYRWRTEGVIPAHFVKFMGARRMLFHPEVVAYLEAAFAAAH